MFFYIRLQNVDECHKAEDNSNRFSITWKVEKKEKIFFPALFKMQLRFQFHFRANTFIRCKRGFGAC